MNLSVKGTYKKTLAVVLAISMLLTGPVGILEAYAEDGAPPAVESIDSGTQSGSGSSATPSDVPLGTSSVQDSGTPIQQRSGATAPAFAEGYPRAGEVQAEGSKKIQVLIKGVLPEDETEMGLGYVLLADNDPVPTAEQIKSAGGKIPGATVITWGTQILGDRETPVTLTGVQDDTDYEFYAVCWKDDVFSEVGRLAVKTPAGSGDPGPSVLAPPTGLQWDTASGIKAKWNAVANAASYDVTLYKEGSSFMLLQYTGLTGTEVNFQSNIAGYTGNYYFTVQAKAEGYTSSLKPASPLHSYIAPLGGNATISNMNPKVGDTLTGSLVYGNNTGTLRYAWKAGGVTVGTDAASYTVTADDLGKTITLEITSSVETGTRTSAPTAAVSAASSVWKVKNETELENALNNFKDSHTITLLNAINYNQGIIIDGKSFCLDLGSYTLNVVNSTGIGIDIKNAILTVSGDGELNATGTKGVQAHNSKISVYSATGTAGAGVVASYSSYAGGVPCEVTVTNLAQGTTAGVYAMNDNCKITAGSAKAAAINGRAVYAEVGGTVEISGDADAPDGYGVYCVNGNATIGGHVTGKSTAVYLWEKGSIVINGNVNTDNGNGTAVEIAGNGYPSNGTVSIEGTVLASDTSYVRFVNGFRTKNEGAPEGAYLQYTDSIDGEKAGIIRVKKVNAVCKIGAQEFTSLTEALAAAKSGGTITFLQTITHTTQIQVKGITVNLDLGNHDLLLDTSANEAFGPALIVENGGKIKLTGEGTGEFHVKGRSGISAIGMNTEATVHTVEAEDGSGVYMYGSGDFLESNSTVTVLGSAASGKNSITVGNGTGVSMNAKNGKVFVKGNIASGRDGVFIASNPGTQATVNGNITVTSDSLTANLVGIRAYGATTVTVTGDVSVQGSDCLGVHASASTIKVGGNVASSGTGAQSDTKGTVEITGSLSAGTPFIVVGTTEMAADQGAETGEGSLLYTDGANTVQIGSVGVPALIYSVTVQNDGHGTASASPSSAEAGIEITLTATPSGGYMFKEWQVISGGVTITGGKFNMPAGNVTVKAIFELLPPDTYSITVQNDGNGTASANPSSAEAGTEITLTATPSSGYVFKAWQIISGSVTITGNKFTMPASNVTIKAIFDETPVQTYMVTINGSHASTTGAGSYTKDETVNIYAGSRSGYTFTGWTSSDVMITDTGNKNANFIMPAKNVTVTANWRYNGGGDSGSSDNDSNSSITPPVASGWLEQSGTSEPIADAKEKGLGYTLIRRNGRYGVRGAAWSALAGYQYWHDTMDGNAVQVRIYIKNPAVLASDLLVSGYVKGPEVDGVKASFERWFKNKVRVIHLDQTGSWGQSVEIAAKVDLTGMDVTKLYLYSYDKATNSYRRIEKPAYWVDKNGYLHFYTALAGDIIISEGPLDLIEK